MNESDEEILRLVERRKHMTADEHWAENAEVARQRIRQDARRPLGVNLAEALELSDFLLSIKIVSEPE